MKAANVDPPRWREAPGEARQAALADAARDVPPLAPEALARIKARVVARPSRTFRGLPRALQLAVLAVVLLASFATAKATATLWRRYVSAPAAPVAPVKRAVSPRPRPRPPQAVVPPAPAPAPRPAPHPRRVAMPAPAETAKPPAPPPETEARMLARALARLRQEHDAAGAVAILDDYARAYPGGLLQAEAFGVRLEAVLQLDDRPAALRLLDGRATFAGRLGRQQLLTRAELRASAGRYADALGDFDRLLAPAAAPATAPDDLERALYGRAVSLGRLGRHDRARADLTAYARQFPQGKHAREVARLLEERRP
jgi:hypothetical protein